MLQSIGMKKVALLDFKSVHPKYSQKQSLTLDWVAKVHADAETKVSGPNDDFLDQLKGTLSKIGLNEDKILKRQMFFDDFFKDNSSERLIYDLTDSSHGKMLDERMALFDEVASDIFHDIYKDKQAPSHLIHTTCTGYSSPSPAQKLVSLKNWGDKTTVTHAYHMGCYAAIPSIRLAHSFISHGDTSCDIVHTEFCSLHMNPLNHKTAQLVIESLFADGAIFYKAIPLEQAKEDCFHILTVHEELISQSLHGMSWQPSHYGFSMNLSKDVPVLIAKHVLPFVERLFKKAGVEFDQEALFAIHPGGPKIIEYVAKIFNLKQEQYLYSEEVLKNHGNMSSATLPHVWDLILKDKTQAHNKLVVSLAFGPGLTMAGALFEIKRAKPK
jgi:predicted naringenin-chalcone synthase